jgi:hypothetical protein
MGEALPWLLSEAEVRQMTGRAHRRLQLAWFVDHGIRAELGADNRVKVLREAAERHMLPSGRATVRRGPNLAALRKTG